MMPADITTDRLRLRSIRADDAKEIARMMTFDVAQYLTRVPWPYTRKDAGEFAARMDGKQGQYGVAYQGQLAGVIGGSRMLGYWVARPFWGKGIATEAGRAYLSHCFSNGEVDLLKSGYAPQNASSGRVLGKLGFISDGVKPAFLNIDREEVLLNICTLSRSRWAGAAQ